MFGRRSKTAEPIPGHTNGAGMTEAMRRLEQIKSAGAQHPAEEAPSVSRELSKDEAERQMAAARHAAATFGEIVTLLMRAPAYGGLPISELEALVVPPLRLGQISVATAQSKTSGVALPVGAVLWARVSPEVADRLAAHAGANVLPAGNEWMSGDIVWVVATVGEGRILSEMLKQLSLRDWAGKEVKIVVRPKDGMPAVATLATTAPGAAA